MRCAQAVANWLGQAAPDQVVRRGGGEALQRRRELRDARDRAVGLGVVVQHPQVRPGQHDRGGGQNDEPDDRRRHHAAVEGRPAPAEPGHEENHADDEQEVQQLEPQGEADAHLPRGHHPARDDLNGAPLPVTAQQEEERQRDAPGRQDVQVPRLAQPPRRVRERQAAACGS